MCLIILGLLWSRPFATLDGTVRWAPRLLLPRGRFNTAPLSCLACLCCLLRCLLAVTGWAWLCCSAASAYWPAHPTDQCVPACGLGNTSCGPPKVFSFVASKGDEGVLLGDFNLPPDRAPVVDARAMGTWRLADETVAGDVPLQPTRRDDQGQPIGRCIDYALSTVGVPALDRQQTPGPADHDLISYTFSIAKDRRGAAACPASSACSEHLCRCDGPSLGARVDSTCC